MEAQLQIWATEGRPLKASEWLANGYASLEDYVMSEIKGHSGHHENSCKTCDKYKLLPLVSFGIFNYKTGEKDIKMTCEKVEDLPTSNIEGVLEFDS